MNQETDTPCNHRVGISCDWCKGNILYIVLGCSNIPYEWRSWVEGIFSTLEDAKKFLTEISADDAGWNSYYIQTGVKRG